MMTLIDIIRNFEKLFARVENLESQFSNLEDLYYSSSSLREQVPSTVDPDQDNTK